MSSPVVSIIMPVFNVGPYVSDAIQSVLNQSFKDFELIIINDASTDNTKEVIHSIKDKRIIYIENSENQQIVKSLNRGLDLVRGEFIARMDGDDLSHPERLRKQVIFLESNAEIGVCCTSMKKFGAIETIVKAVENPNEVKYGLALNATLPGATMLARTSIFKENNLTYSTEHLFAEDYHFLTKLSNYTQLASIPDVLYNYRIHGENISYQKAAQIKNDAAHVRYEYLERIMSHTFSNEKLKRAAFAWLSENDTIGKFALDEILDVYETLYIRLFGEFGKRKTGVLNGIINEYFFYLMRYMVVKGNWLLPYYFKKGLYNFSPGQIVKLIGSNMLKKYDGK